MADKPNMITKVEAEELLNRSHVEMISVMDIATIAGVGRSTVYEWAAWDSFPKSVIDVGRTRRWRLSDILYWLATGGQD